MKMGTGGHKLQPLSTERNGLQTEGLIGPYSGIDQLLLLLHFYIVPHDTHIVR
jgi:hypothetical protein